MSGAKGGIVRGVKWSLGGADLAPHLRSSIRMYGASRPVGLSATFPHVVLNSAQVKFIFPFQLVFEMYVVFLRLDNNHIPFGDVEYN